jgi:AAA family ATP:ADP antiporter
VAPIGHAGLLVLAAVLLLLSALAAVALHRWRDSYPVSVDETTARARPLGGHPFAGATTVFRSPYLATIALFVVLLAVVTTFLYFEQARLVAETFPDRTRQTQVFGTIDIIVQSLTILIQIFLTGRIAERFGIGTLLVAVPLVMAAGFLWLAVAPVFVVLAVIMIARRVGEYALVRPGREMLFTVVDAEAKYKAKSFIDTVVYRGGDAIGGWVKRALDVLAENPAAAMLIGAVIALVWAGTGAWLGRNEKDREARSIPFSQGIS